MGTGQLLAAAAVCGCALAYAGVGAILASLIDAHGVGWWAMVIGWPVVLVVLALVAFAAISMVLFTLRQLAGVLVAR